MIAKDFSMRYTIESAQPLAFCADYSFSGSSGSVVYATRKGVFRVRAYQHGKDAELSYEYSGKYSAAGARSEITRRFGLDHDIKEIYKRISTDSNIKDAISRYYGLRVTLNDPWEAALSFVVSQFNNVKRIRRIMKALIENYGEEADSSLGIGRLFPEPEAIAAATVKELMACGTGFRAKYIKELAEEWNSIERKNLASKGYQEAKAELMEMNGIGDKVADCILLMGYGKLEAFPIDTWIKRVMEREYLKKCSSIKEIHNFAEKKWGSYAGYAQQYIFWHGRSAGRK